MTSVCQNCENAFYEDGRKVCHCDRCGEETCALTCLPDDLQYYDRLKKNPEAKADMDLCQECAKVFSCNICFSYYRYKKGMYVGDSFWRSLRCKEHH